MPASWTWVLCDSYGVPAAGLDVAAGKTITYRRNSYHEAACVVSAEDDAAYALWDLLERPDTPTLRAYRNGRLRFHGELVPFVEEVDATSAVSSLTFCSGMFDLIQRPNLDERVYTATEQTAIVSHIFANYYANDNGRLLLGSVTPTAVLRDRTINFGATWGDEVIALTRLDGGLELVERPAAALLTSLGYSALGTLDMAATIGVSRDSVRFEHGASTLANATSARRTVGRVVNAAFVRGGNGLYASAIDVPSLAAHGPRYAAEVNPDVTAQATLNARAMAMLRGRVPRLLSISPDPALAPGPFDEWDLGDTVGVLVRRGAVVEEVEGRVNAFTVQIGEDGLESPAIPDPLAPGALRAAVVQLEV